MVYLQSDYIITPLGEGVESNLKAIVQGKTELRRHTIVHGEKLVNPVMASLLDDVKYQLDGYTFFESLCIRSIEGALQGIQLNNTKCIFILSSTKGDIWCSMAKTASHIATYFNNHNAPIVVSTACTSGVVAQITAKQAIESGMFDTAIVVGTDVQREFIVSGFQSFHALSNLPCKPFDKERDGLNAGEAVACMVLGKQPKGLCWTLMGGSIHNDANHISGPSRTAEGSWRCLQDMLHILPKEELACISVHGTGTQYNDEMESLALHRATIDDIPVLALKGYYGHTMGSAGLLETILSLHALANGQLLPVKGYQEQGTTYPLNISATVRTSNKRGLIKILSGFGGVNAAVAWTIDLKEEDRPPLSQKWKVESSVYLDSKTNVIDQYKQLIGNYPKFYKMDKLCQIGLIAVESLLKKMKDSHPDFNLDTETTAIIIANKSASIKNDSDYQKTINDRANYFPSPALFVYTLPNIVTGELAIRHHIYGETSCYIQENMDVWQQYKELILTNITANPVIYGWVECRNENEYEANLELLIKE